MSLICEAKKKKKKRKKPGNSPTCHSSGPKFPSLSAFFPPILSLLLFVSYIMSRVFTCIYLKRIEKVNPLHLPTLRSNQVSLLTKLNLYMCVCVCMCLYVFIHAQEPMFFFLLVDFSGPLASMKCPRVHGSILKIVLLLN